MKLTQLPIFLFLQVGVVGTIGSGKSSLLSALLGDMVRLEGEANVRGKIAYVPQQAWIRNATLRTNILFGKKFKQEAYNRVRRFFKIYKNVVCCYVVLVHCFNP